MRRTQTRWPIKAALWLSAIALALAAQSVAFGQDLDEGEEEFNPDPPVADGEKLGMGSVDDDLDLYWGGKRNVQVVEDRVYDKGGRLEFSLFGGLIPNDPFVTNIPLGARAAYFFVDSFAIEVGGSWAGVTLDSELKDFLEDNREIDPDTDLRDVQQWRANAVAVWAPLYGKLALLQRKLSHFDIYVAAGGGVVGTQVPNADRSNFESAVKPEGIIGLGTRVFVNEWFAMRLDYRQGFFPATGADDDTGSGIVLPVELTLGFAFMTGG